MSLSDPTVVDPSVTSRNADVYTFSLVVSDAELLSAPSEVSVAVTR